MESSTDAGGGGGEGEELRSPITTNSRVTNEPARSDGRGPKSDLLIRTGLDSRQATPVSLVIKSSRGASRDCVITR